MHWVAVARGATAEKRVRSLELRQEMTAAERLLWTALRMRRRGVKFRRQHIIAGLIVDFYAAEVGLVIEVDGGVHDGQFDEDLARAQALEALGLAVIRVRNEDVLADLEGVIRRIDATIASLNVQASS
jgi:very-short-patch-repair endonuclease